jgi:hypothetical protein
MCLFATLLLIPSLFIVDYLLPGKIKNVMLRTSWRAMELCSKAETYITNTYYHYRPFLSTFLDKTPQQNITFIYQGEEVVKYSVQEFARKAAKKQIDFKYDFLLHEISNQSIGKYDKYDSYVWRYEKHQDLTCDKIYVSYDATKSIELNMIQFAFKNSAEVYAIDFKRKQFMLKRNVLFDRMFFKWYLNIYFNKKINDDDKYTITFIDHDMNYIILPDYCYLLVNSHGYDIINVITDEVSAGSSIGSISGSTTDEGSGISSGSTSTETSTDEGANGSSKGITSGAITSDL